MKFKQLVSKLHEKKAKEEGTPETTAAYAKATPGQPPVVFDTDIQYDGHKVAAEINKSAVKEEAELDEDQTSEWQQIQSMEKGGITGGKEGIRKRIAYLNAVLAFQKKYGKDTVKTRKSIGALNRTRTSEEVEVESMIEKSLGQFAKGLGDTVLRKAKVKTTKGKPNMKDAPRWASALGKTPQGAWHWLQKDGPVETDKSDKYFPLSGKTQFTGFVSEGLTEKDEREYGYEGDMAISQLKTITRHADHMMGMLKPETDLPEWVQSKITLATDYMQTAHDYMMSEMTESYDGRVLGRITSKEISKVLGSTKNAAQGVEALKKAFNVTDAQAKSMLDRVMKESVEQIDESEDKTIGRLKQLVRFGLMDKSKLAILSRSMKSLEKGQVTNPTERNTLFELLNELIGVVTGDDAMFAKVRMNVQKEEFDKED